MRYRSGDAESSRDSGLLQTQFSRLVKKPIDAAVQPDRAAPQLVLIRHGQALPVEQRDASELFDPPLTALGRAQALASARALRSMKIVAVYSSDMQRCMETAEKVAGAHRLAVRPTQALREVAVLRGLPPGRLPTEALSESGWHEAGQRFVETGRWEAFPLSETGSELRDRVVTALDAVIDVERHGAVCVVSHGGVINAYLAALLRTPRDYFFAPAHCSMSVIGTTGTRRVIITLNDTSHIPVAKRSS